MNININMINTMESTTVLDNLLASPQKYLRKIDKKMNSSFPEQISFI